MNLLLINNLQGAKLAAVVISFIIPALTALIYRRHWDPFWAGIISLVLATANGFFTEWVRAGDSFHWQAALGTAVTSFVLAVFARLGIYKTTGVDAKLVDIGSKRPAYVVPVQPEARAA